MELPDELKPDLHRTLLGPLSLANEIFGALLPGCIFALLLLLKGYGVTLLSYPLLGYKTKLTCAVLLSYVFGKVVFGMVGVICELVLNRSIKDAGKPQTKGNDQEQQNLLQSLATVVSESLNAAPKELKTFIAGMLAGPFMLGKSRAYDYYAASVTQVNFYLSTGIFFLIGAAIPGDGKLRFLEATVAVLLLARGIRSLWTMKAFLAGLMGMMVGDALTGLQPGQLSKGLKTGWSILNVLIKAKVPSDGVQAVAKVPDQENLPSAVPDAAGVAPPENQGVEVQN